MYPQQSSQDEKQGPAVLNSTVHAIQRLQNYVVPSFFKASKPLSPWNYNPMRPALVMSVHANGRSVRARSDGQGRELRECNARGKFLDMRWRLGLWVVGSGSRSLSSNRLLSRSTAEDCSRTGLVSRFLFFLVVFLAQSPLAIVRFVCRHVFILVDPANPLSILFHNPR